MADEKKTYLVNVESNLKKYIDELIEAKKRLDEAKLAVDNLQKGQFKSREEIEKVNASYRQAKTDVGNAKKMLDTYNLAIKAETGSYEQLYRIKKLEEIQLKTAPGMYKIGANGISVLTDKYIAHSRATDNDTKSLLAFGKGIHDNKLNVGNYSEVLQGAIGNMAALPGPVGKAGQAIERFTTTLSKVGPIGLAIAGIGAIISAPFIAFFKSTQEGMDMIKGITARLGAEFDVVKGKVAGLGKAIVDAFKKPEEEKGLFVKTLTSAWEGIEKVAMGITWLGTSIIPGMHKGMQQFADDLKEAGDAGKQIQLNNEALYDAETKLIPQRAEANKQIKEARLAYSDINKTNEERITLLDTALKLEQKTADNEIAHQKLNVTNIKASINLKIKEGLDTREDYRKIAEAEAKIIDLQAASAAHQIFATSQLKSARKELLAEDFKLISSEKKLDDISTTAKIEHLKITKKIVKINFEEMLADEAFSYDEREKMRTDFDQLNRDIDEQILNEQKILLKNKRDLDIKEIDTRIQKEELSANERENIEIQYQADLAKIIEEGGAAIIAADAEVEKRRRDAKETRIKAGIDAEKADNENKIQTTYEYLDSLEQIILKERDIERASTIFKAKSKEEQLKIETRYTAALLALSRSRIQQEISDMSKLGAALGQLASSFEENTAAYKLFSIAQATIAVFTAAAQAMADWQTNGVVAKLASVALILAEGFNLINAIKGVSTGAPAHAASAGSSAINRPLAQPVGTTILNQPQLTQAQTNSIVYQNMFTIEDFVKALENLPNPIVTVEDINAKTKSVNKVSVRANI
ncbi:MAG: hypothetical protein MUO72_09480 [Bacteroidales bacterium]|nr:hypothetical protein [Bacteroidales bacterium]